MTPDEINITIAELCGSTWYKWGDAPEETNRYLAPPGTFAGGHMIPCERPSHGKPCNLGEVLNCHGSLDAMHEAEKVMNAGQINNYLGHLYSNAKIANSESNPWEIIAARVATHATAHQRAEAFLRVFGKWEDAQ